MRAITVAVAFQIVMCGMAATGSAQDKLPGKREATEEQVEESGQKKPSSDFWDYFAPGLLMGYLPAKGAAIKDAELDHGIVRVRKRLPVVVGLGVQAFLPLFSGWTTYRRKDETDPWHLYSEWKFGLFIAASLDSDHIIDTVGLGLALQKRLQDIGIRLGAGVLFDPASQFLGAGYVDNQAAPMDSEGVKYTSKPAVGFLVMVGILPGFGS